MPGKPARNALGEFEHITRHPSSSRSSEASLTWPKSRPTHAIDATDKNLHNTSVLQPALEEGRVLLLEEERETRAARLDDAVFESRQPRLRSEGLADKYH